MKMPGADLGAPSRLFLSLSCFGATLIASGGLAVAQEAPELTVVEVIEVPEADADAPSRRWLGFMLDAGVPDGGNLNVVWRPDYWLRFHAGPSHNGVGFGLRGGVSLLPFDSWFTPSFVLEGGYFFPGDLDGFVEGVLGASSEGIPEQVRYAYGNAHLGLEFGTSDFGFYLRGGYSLIDAYVAPPAATVDGVRLEGDSHITAFVPTAKLGFVIYVL
ncbi:MAG: hypothetical protein AAFU79_29870 [Myxococcota bacterium]